MGVSTLVQMMHGVPRLQLTNSQIAWVSILAATASIFFIFGLCVLTVFPLPFGLLIAGPPFVLVIATCFTYISGPQWRADPSILVDVKRQLVVYNCQTTLPFVYPLYIYGFVSLTGWNQVVFVSILPVIQIFAKNWISRALADDYDQKPQCVIFVVEVYNALYISNVLQTASSWTSTAAIMAIDILQFWVSMRDIVKLLDEVNLFMRKIPQHHPLAKHNFVQVAICLRSLETNKTKHEIIQKSHEEPRISDIWNQKRQQARIFPCNMPPQRIGFLRNKLLNHKMAAIMPEQQNSNHSILSPSLESFFSREERDIFIKKTAHILFITEYLVLVEYVEMVLPLVYCASNFLCFSFRTLLVPNYHINVCLLSGLHQLALFYMHNSAFYPTLAGVSSEQFSSKMFSTFLYSFFEFGSFVMLIVVLKRRLGYSSLEQLAFVLDTQARVVQTKLNLIFVYIMQVSLAHHGADFSFKFAWLHSDRTP
ncbi:hypothetical protein PHMEG_00031365, partial [Phytophthora megakarya]